LDKSAFKTIFDQYFDAIRSYVYYRCADEAVASDIAQDVFMRVWEKRERLDPNSIKPLLYKMANDMFVSEYRKSAVRLSFAKDITVGSGSVSPHDEMQYEELKRKYADALDGMNPLQRETFLMSRNDELKYAEISERLGISVKAVEKRMSQALSYLKSKLL